jgi:hypothetical protein
MRWFPSATDLASSAGICPGNRESAGKRKSGKTTKGNRALRTTLVQVACTAARTKGTSLAARYRRLTARRRKMKAIIAVAHSILVMRCDIFQRQEPYREARADYFDRLRPDDIARRLVTRLQGLGYHVILQKPSEGVET